MDSDGSTPPQDNGHPPDGHPPDGHPPDDRPVDSAPVTGSARQQPPPGQPPTAGEVVVPGPDSTMPAAGDDRPAHLFGYLAIYTLLRLALVAVLTAVLVIFMPLIVALLFAIIIQLPLSWLLFAGPRRRVNEAMARTTAQRRIERDRLQAALSGEEPPD